jgi:Zn-dependent M28 family amino/carboxypeptidase
MIMMITSLASLANVNSIMIAYASEYSNISHRICLFTVSICLDDQPQREKSKETDNLVHMIDRVNSTTLKNWIDNLTLFQTRHTKSGYIEDVAYWLKNELQSVCNGRVYLHNFTQSDQGKSYSLKNIICDQGSALANDDKGHHVLISAHYDSRMEDFNQSNGRAPGADDNASGVAAVLELARVLSKVGLKNNIQFVLFSGEEQGQWGSLAYVKQQQTNNTKLDLVMNLDMVGYPSLGLGNVIIEYDLGNKNTTNDAYSKNVAKFIAQIDSEYTNLEASLQPLGKTDLIPFEAIGNTVIGLHDGGSELNPNYHSTSDTPDTLDIGYLTSTTKLALATILNLD